ncbi:MAG: hypothetical protein K2W82_15255 [Candidatus Obscuribacterales bacterium]|nr:hypothetical protein [Candidatus Obscuribacterales bacterium]
MNLWQKLSSMFKKKPVQECQPDSDEALAVPCCSSAVHIAFRGLSDDRLYLSRNRTWQEVRFFRANGLRVFCALCRRRIV